MGIVGPFLFVVVVGWLPALFMLGAVPMGSTWDFYYAKSRVISDGAIFHLFACLGQWRFEGLDRELRNILKRKWAPSG